MVVTLNLPFRGIESNTCVGPFFWSAWDQDEENPHLRMLYPVLELVCRTKKLQKFSTAKATYGKKATPEVGN